MQNLSGLLGAVIDYHRQSCQILENLRSNLQSRLESWLVQRRQSPCT